MKKIIIAVAIIIVLALGLWYYKARDVVASAPTVINTYKDGAYTAEGSYISPAGKESIGVALIIKNNLITEATFTPKATNEVSIKLQKMFSTGYKQYVIGKSLDEVKLDKVSGASLTPKGWNAAIEKIKIQARA